MKLASDLRTVYLGTEVAIFSVMLVSGVEKAGTAILSANKQTMSFIVESIDRRVRRVGSLRHLHLQVPDDMSINSDKSISVGSVVFFRDMPEKIWIVTGVAEQVYNEQIRYMLQLTECFLPGFEELLSGDPLVSYSFLAKYNLL